MRTVGLVKHGQAGKNSNPSASTKVYRAWKGMKSRCYNPKSHYFWRYGGRGITVCEKWRNDFSAFFNDVGNPPSGAHSLDRYPDRNGNYEPGNVRWATKLQQVLNRDGRILCAGKRVTDREASELLNESVDNVRYWSQHYEADLIEIARYVKECRSRGVHPRLFMRFEKRKDGENHARRAERARLARAAA